MIKVWCRKFSTADAHQQVVIELDVAKFDHANLFSLVLADDIQNLRHAPKVFSNFFILFNIDSVSEALCNVFHQYRL